MDGKLGEVTGIDILCSPYLPNNTMMVSKDIFDKLKKLCKDCGGKGCDTCKGKGYTL